MNSKLVVVAIVLATTALATTGCSQATEPEEASESAAEAISACAVIVDKTTNPPNTLAGNRTYWQVHNRCAHAVNVRIDVVSHQDPGCQVIPGGAVRQFSLGIGLGDPLSGFRDRGVVDC